MQNSILAEYAAHNRSLGIRKKRQEMRQIWKARMGLRRRSRRQLPKRIQRR